MKKVLVTGASGFIGSHLAKALKEEGCWVRGVDWKEPEFMKPTEFCHNFQLLDLRYPAACNLVFQGPKFDEVYQLAADMGGMGFISKNNALIGYNNALINLHMLEAARANGCGAYLFTSSACIYPVNLQEQDLISGLREEDAYPALPQKVYGCEKLYAEQVVQAYHEDHGLNTHIVRFHNIMGEKGSWTGGREKAPAAFARKVAIAKRDRLDTVEMWGDGEQTRTFLHVDDCVRAIVGIQRCDYHGPVNIGSEEPVTMNFLMDTMMFFAGYYPQVVHIDGPVGVRGRNCDSTLIRKLIGWEPQISLQDGCGRIYQWVEGLVCSRS